MVRNRKLAKAISDVGWGTFVNFLDYKVQKEGKVLVEISRWFPSSKLCSNCHYQVSELPLNVREWTCPNCGTKHDRDGNAAANIRAGGGDVRPKRGRKSKQRQSSVRRAYAVPVGRYN